MDKRILNEMQHGAKIAERAEEIWNWSGPAGERRWARRVELLTSRVPRGARVLEIGCGTGLFTQELARRSFLTFSIDVSIDLARQAKKRSESSPHVFVSIQNAYDTALPAASFDVVIGMSVLHHLDLDRALAEFQRLLRAGGVLLFSEPNMLNPIILVQKNIPWVKKLAGDSPDETAFVRWPLERKLTCHGFEVVAIQPFDFLHPVTPRPMVGMIERLSSVLENTPGVREIAGSLFIMARKPGGL